jgi:plastocyanin
MHERIWLTIGVLTVSVTGAGAAWAKPPAPSRVAMQDADPNAQNWHFEPGDVTVKAGTTVVWDNQGAQEHTVSAADNSFDSGPVAPGKNWQHAFSAPGDFSYSCKPHPWMKAVIHVTR